MQKRYNVEKRKNDATYVVKGIEIKNWNKIQQSSNRVIRPATKIILKQSPRNNKVYSKVSLKYLFKLLPQTLECIS